MTGFDLHGKTVGVIGTGRIGRVFIDICRGFGMKVLAYDKFPAKGLDNGDTVRYVSLDELFAYPMFQVKGLLQDPVMARYGTITTITARLEIIL